MLPAEAPRPGRNARLAARALSARLALAAAAAALLVPGCGNDGDGAPDPQAWELTVTVHPEGLDGPSQTAELRCPADPSPEADACVALQALPADAADPVPPGVACTQIYGGPDVVQLEGTLDGEPIDTELTRSDGCEIDRFERFAPVLEALFEDYEPGRGLRP